MPKSKLNKLGLDNTVFKNEGKKIYEDTTEYGEFISTFDCWMTLEEQKRNAEYLANLDKINKLEMEEERFKNL